MHRVYDVSRYGAPHFNAWRFGALRFDAPHFDAPHFNAWRFGAPCYDVSRPFEDLPDSLNEFRESSLPCLPLVFE